MSGKKSCQDIIKKLAENYGELEHSLVNQLLLEVPNHHPTGGSYRESVWSSLFEMIIPKKYCIEQGVFIIDSYGNISNEVDLIIFDEMYTPYIFNYGKIKFIPIEAVAAVVQCKSKSVVGTEVLKWKRSIDKLLTSIDAVARMATNITDNDYTMKNIEENKKINPNRVTQTATRPISIFCAVTEMNEIPKSIKRNFDLILAVDRENRRLQKYMEREGDSLSKWNTSLNHALEDDSLYRTSILTTEKWKRKKIIKMIPEDQREHLLGELKVQETNKDREHILLSLIFQLNQLLMVLNNPMLFPHRAYAKLFNTVLSQSPQQGGPENAK